MLDTENRPESPAESPPRAPRLDMAAPPPGPATSEVPAPSAPKRRGKLAPDPLAVLRAALAGEVPEPRLPAVLEAVERFAVDALKTRLAAGRAAKKRATGRCEGGKPYGYEKGEAPILEILVYLRRRNRRSYEQIADNLNDAGHRTRSRQPWTAERVRCVYRTWKRNQKPKRKGKA